MRDKSLFQLNTRVRVVDEEQQKYYHATIQEVGEKSFFINVPLSAFNEKLKMPEHSRWNFYLIADDAMYGFVSRVLGHREDQVWLIEIDYPEQLERWQRRRFFRFSWNLEVEYWVVEGKGSGGDISERKAGRVLQKWYSPGEGSSARQLTRSREAVNLPEGRHGYTVDISGGGLQFTAPRYIPEGTVLLINLQIGNDSLMLKGRITRTAKMDTVEVNKYRLGVEFIELEDKVRDLIISHIFEEMRRRMK